MTLIPRRSLPGRRRASLLWALGLFVLGQAVLGMWLQRRHPEMCDPTFELRYQRLQQRLAEAPGRPLVLVLGSSRPATGLCPSALADGQSAAVVFNFATLGGGPVRELLTYRRLLARGVHTDLLLVEVWPAFWLQGCPNLEQRQLFHGDLHFCDVPVLAHLYGQGWESFTQVCEQALTPILHHRLEALHAYAPFLLERNTGADQQANRLQWASLDGWGWLPVQWGRAPPDAFAAGLEEARKATQPSLAGFQWAPEVDWTVRRLLTACRQQRTRVAFFLMPEHSALRSWYTPRTHAVVRAYLRRLEEEFGTPVVDTRDWMADDDFVDYCHLLPAGAREFSARFGREVLPPLLQGAALPAHLGLRPCAEETPGSSGSSAPLPALP
jgi:hypothetical protein